MAKLTNAKIERNKDDNFKDTIYIQYNESTNTDEVQSLQSLKAKLQDPANQPKITIYDVSDTITFEITWQTP
jgi:cell division septal protein FtsQ